MKEKITCLKSTGKKVSAVILLKAPQYLEMVSSYANDQSAVFRFTMTGKVEKLPDSEQQQTDRKEGTHDNTDKTDV